MMGARRHIQAIARAGLLIVQLVIAAFYAWTAMLMWGPFMAATLTSKSGVAVIVLWPIIGLIVASRGRPFIGLGVTSALALLTAAHVIIVLAFVMNA